MRKSDLTPKSLSCDPPRNSNDHNPNTLSTIAPKPLLAPLVHIGRCEDVGSWHAATAGLVRPMSVIGRGAGFSQSVRNDVVDPLRHWTDTRPNRTIALFWTPNRTYNGDSRSQVCLWPRFAFVNPQTAYVSPIRRVAAARR